MSKKIVTFDLITEKLKEYYPVKSYTHAYDNIKDFMTKNGFQWLQHSVYVSKSSMTDIEVTNLLNELVIKYPWLNLCMRDCRSANIYREYDKNYLFDKEMVLPKREEMLESANEDLGDVLDDFEKLCFKSQTLLPNKTLDR